MAQTHLPPQWEERLMAIVNAHGWNTGAFDAQVIRLLTAWQQAEGGTAQWNPLNTTFYVAAWVSSDYNSSGVRNYSKPTYGVMATAATLVNGYYNHILGWMQSPQITAEECVKTYADEFRTWGTNPDTILACLSTL